MGRNHGQEQQAPLTKYEKNDMISRVMPYFRGIALFFWQGPTVMVFHEYERSLFVIMDDGYPPVSILILIGFILLEAVFYGFGSAIQNVNEGKLEEEAAGGNKKAARLLEIVNRPVRFVHTIQVTTHLMGMIIGAAILPAMIGMVERRFLLGKVLAWAEPAQLMAMSGTPWYRNPSWWQWAGVLALVTVFVLVLVISFGIIIPKRLAAKEPEKWGYHMLPVVLFFAGVFLPLTRLITLISSLVLKPFGVDLADDDGNVTEEDIMSMVNEGHEQGVLEADETEMITNIFELGDKEAADIMTHRTNMTALDGSMSLKEAVDFILNEGVNTRYPVYGEDIDDIIGILHMRDAMAFAEKEENRDRMIKDIPGLLREANFIPETRNIDTLFKEMQSRKIHMEIVVDEYGQTAGLLTMEDILEEIVGNIMDEYDEEEDFIQAMEDGTFVMSGLTPLEDVMETLDIELPEEDSDTYDTLNGYLVSRLDRIPQEGENPQVEFGGWLFEVERAGNKMIESVRVVPVPEGGKAADSGKELVEEKYDAVNREYEGDVS